MRQSISRTSLLTSLQLGINLQAERVTLCEEQRCGLHDAGVQAGFPPDGSNGHQPGTRRCQARFSLWLADLRNGFVGVGGGSSQR
ncbi:hypothetical protein P4050_16525 [Pseudomonas aeruginosa]|nr:hypothetical protein [Pseudomonas aeruginosa]